MMSKYIMGLLIVGLGLSLAGCDRGGRSEAEMRRLVEELQDADPAVRLVAARTLNNYSSLYYPQQEPRAIEALAHCVIADPDEDVRVAAIQTLGLFGRRAGAARLALVAAVADPSTRVRTAAARSLAKIGGLSDDDLRTLAENLGHEDRNVRTSAAMAIGSAGPEGAVVLASLRQFANEPDERIRSAVAEALGEIGPPAAPLTEMLVEWVRTDPGLAGQGRYARARACEALGKIGPDARESLGALLAAMADEDALIRAHAARAVWLITASTSLPTPVLEACLEATMPGYVYDDDYDEHGNPIRHPAPVPDTVARTLARRTLDEMTVEPDEWSYELTTDMLAWRGPMGRATQPTVVVAEGEEAFWRTPSMPSPLPGTFRRLTVGDPSAATPDVRAYFHRIDREIEIACRYPVFGLGPMMCIAFTRLPLPGPEDNGDDVEDVYHYVIYTEYVTAVIFRDGVEVARRVIPAVAPVEIRRVPAEGSLTRDDPAPDVPPTLDDWEATYLDAP
jgi:hypothetical protein